VSRGHYHIFETLGNTVDLVASAQAKSCTHRCDCFIMYCTIPHKKTTQQQKTKAPLSTKAKWLAPHNAVVRSFYSTCTGISTELLVMIGTNKVTTHLNYVRDKISQLLFLVVKPNT